MCEAFVVVNDSDIEVTWQMTSLQNEIEEALLGSGTPII
jgi:hypothetical protein